MRPEEIAKIRTICKKIGERSGILERVGAVGAEESAAVGAEFLDDFLRGDRALRDHLLRHDLRGGLAVRARHLHCLRLDKCSSGVGLQILDHALRDEHERAHQADRQQNPEQAARDVHPEIAELVGFLARDAANDGDGQHDADGGGSKVVIGETGHLREIAHGRFAAVGLPVGVGGEGRGGVERQSRRRRWRVSAD